MKEIDFNMLKKCVNFPIVIDEYGKYIWDNSGNMLAQFTDRTYLELAKTLICGEIRSFDGEITSNFYSLDSELNIYNNLNPKKPIGCIRGWGNLQYKYNIKKKTKKYDPEGGFIRQDNLALYIIKCLNTPKKNEFSSI